MSTTSPVSFRFASDVKLLLEKAAALDHRSQTNFLENLIRTYCENKKISIAPITKTTPKK